MKEKNKSKDFSFPSKKEIRNLQKHILREKDKNVDQLKKASREWLIAHWENKLSYEINWLGMPIIQTAEDMIIMQEIIFDVKPDFILEMGIAHGGSLIYYASLLKMLGRGRVIGVDIDIREHNKNLLEKHPMIDRIELIQASSVSKNTYNIIRRKIPQKAKVIVILDSNHEREHVLKEMELYSSLVSKNSYLVVCDTIASQLAGLRHSKEDFLTNNPMQAVNIFMKKNPGKFIIDEKREKLFITYFPRGFLKKA